MIAKFFLQNLCTSYFWKKTMEIIHVDCATLTNAFLPWARVRCQFFFAHIIDLNTLISCLIKSEINSVSRFIAVYFCFVLVVDSDGGNLSTHSIKIDQFPFVRI